MTKKLAVKKKTAQPQFISISEIENLPELQGEVSESKMTEMSNENSVIGQSDYPYFTFDGKYGTYKLNGNEVKSKIRILMLKFRQTYFAFSDNRQEKWMLFTEEFDNWGEKVKLFKNENGKREQVGEGSIAELKQTFETLKMKQIIYSVLLTENEKPQIVKFTVKGTALRELFNFYKEFSPKIGEARPHVYQYIVELGTARDHNQSGDEYNIPTYAKVRKIEGKEELVAIQKAMLDIESKIISLKDRGNKKEEVQTVEELPPVEGYQESEVSVGITEMDLERAGLTKPPSKTVEQVKADLKERIERANHMGRTSPMKL